MARTCFDISDMVQICSRMVNILKISKLEVAVRLVKGVMGM